MLEASKAFSGIAVRDIDRSRHFFAEVLGLTVDDCIKYFPNRFELTLAATNRARQIALGATAIDFVLGIVLWRTIRIAMRADDLFGALVATGIACWFTFQAFENIGMNLGIMPVTGLPMPFISYGGSSLVTFFVLLALGVASGGARAARGAAMEEVGVEAGENEELVRTLHMDEEAFVGAGVLQSFDVVDAVKAVEFAGGKPLLGCGWQAEVSTDDGDVVGYFEIIDTGLHECVSDDGEEEHLGR